MIFIIHTLGQIALWEILPRRMRWARHLARMGNIGLLLTLQLTFEFREGW